MKLLKTPRVRAYLGLAVLAAGLLGLALSGDLLVHSAALRLILRTGRRRVRAAGDGGDEPARCAAPSSPP